MGIHPHLIRYLTQIQRSAPLVFPSSYRRSDIPLIYGNEPFEMKEKDCCTEGLPPLMLRTFDI
jgi:hypothetical protein